MKKESNADRLLKALIVSGERGINSIYAMRYAGSRASARKLDLKKKGWIIHSLPDRFHGIQSARWILHDFIRS